MGHSPDENIIGTSAKESSLLSYTSQRILISQESE